ncbi:Solute carrier family 35 member F1 [Heterocephalus glaber]|uniref:Solute carrier family 35 member F1 n=1 Tax=Heterocephalus glaber TaxID=10181 RepID=G5BBJ5_HETGA|nr:Solute carrier family 35 member F1 [Heterocephalus glaber]
MSLLSACDTREGVPCLEAFSCVRAVCCDSITSSQLLAPQEPDGSPSREPASKTPLRFRSWIKPLIDLSTVAGFSDLPKQLKGKLRHISYTLQYIRKVQLSAPCSGIVKRDSRAAAGSNGQPGLREGGGRDCVLAAGEMLISVALGQVLSLLICGIGLTSKYLSEDFHANTPVFQSFLNYILLFLVYTTTLAVRQGEENLLAILRRRWWKYMILGLIDLEANYLVVKAYQYTTLTSIQLLDCFVIPVVILLSWFFLLVRYKAVHFLGIVVCILGMGCMVGADVLVGRHQGAGENKLVGDLLVLGGATLYGISNVWEEHVVRTLGRVEFLGMVGLFGAFFSGIQLAIMEHRELLKVPWDWQIGLLYVSFSACMFGLYSFMPVVIKRTSATAVNLSLLTADLYSLFCGLFLFHYKKTAAHLQKGFTSNPAAHGVVLFQSLYRVGRQPWVATSLLHDCADVRCCSRDTKAWFHGAERLACGRLCIVTVGPAEDKGSARCWVLVPEGDRFSGLYLLSFFTILIGLVLYSSTSTYIAQDPRVYKQFRNPAGPVVDLPATAQVEPSVTYTSLGQETEEEPHVRVA